MGDEASEVCRVCVTGEGNCFVLLASSSGNLKRQRVEEKVVPEGWHGLEAADLIHKETGREEGSDAPIKPNKWPPGRLLGLI